MGLPRSRLMGLPVSAACSASDCSPSASVAADGSGLFPVVASPLGLMGLFSVVGPFITLPAEQQQYRVCPPIRVTKDLFVSPQADMSSDPRDKQTTHWL